MNDTQLRRYFKGKGLSTGEVARMIDMGYSYTSGLINGSVPLTDSARFRIMRAFPETAEFLMQVDPPAQKEHNGNHKSAERANWSAMMQRCYNPLAINYSYYGERGIKVCERWHDFDSFLADMGPRPTPEHTLGRIDGNLDYMPGNCRWETRSEQADNRRPASGTNGESEPTPLHVYRRIRAGWDPEIARTQPVRAKRAQVMDVHNQEAK